ncbi:MAG: hypothetical protein DRJ01_13820 [Bacteroidetes bacterium]|nr:MAG: hypothetical protein DRJ01_13820 [Bacteroidota bacterium]
MSNLQAYKEYKPVQFDYIDKLPADWKLLPNIAIFQERIERGFIDEELLSVTIGKGVIKQSELDKKDSSTLDKSKYLLIHPGDLVYSMRFRQGASGYSNYKGIVSPACTVLQPKRNIQINPKYFFYVFRTGFYKNYVERFSYGIADGQIPLRYKDFKRMYSIVPPLETQNAIVEYLDQKTKKIQEFISKKERLIELLEEQKKKNITIKLSTKNNSKLYYSGIKWIGNIPIGWNVINLKYLVKHKLKYGANEEAKNADINEPRYIRITDFGYDGKLRNDTYRSLPLNKAKEYLLKEGDILFARSGATVGKSFQFKNFTGLACFAGYLIKATPNEKIILSDYLYLYTQSLFFEAWKNQIFDKATIENIGADKYSVLKVIVPPVYEQKEIVKKIIKDSNIFNNSISKAKTEITKIKEYQESLITNIVTGKTKVPELIANSKL